jgi:hypothetical protein
MELNMSRTIFQIARDPKSGSNCEHDPVDLTEINKKNEDQDKEIETIKEIIKDGFDGSYLDFSIIDGGTF